MSLRDSWEADESQGILGSILEVATDGRAFTHVHEQDAGT